MKYHDISCKVSSKLGFSTLYEMSESEFDMDLCWGNGFNHEKLAQLLQKITLDSEDDIAAHNLLYYMSVTTEGSQSIVDYCKTFGGSPLAINALIKGMDRIPSTRPNSSIKELRLSRVLDAIEGLLDGEEIPFVNIHKPNFITDLRFWQIITQSCKDEAEVMRGLSGQEFSAARLHIASKVGQFADDQVMKAWSFPGYLATAMRPADQVEFFSFLSEHIGERLAFSKIANALFESETVSTFVKSVASTNSMNHWKNTFRIRDCGEFFNSPVKGRFQTALYDLMASSISANPEDTALLTKVKKTAISSMIARGTLSHKPALVMAGKSNRIKGEIVSDGLGI